MKWATDPWSTVAAHFMGSYYFALFALKAHQENSQMQGFARHLVNRKYISALKVRHVDPAYRQCAQIPGPLDPTRFALRLPTPRALRRQLSFVWGVLCEYDAFEN